MSITPQDASLAPGLIPQTACSNFFPRCCAASSRDKQLLQPSCARCGPYGCGSPSGLRIAIKAAMSRAETANGDYHGPDRYFTRGEDGVFAGTIKTLSLNVKARLVPATLHQRQARTCGAGGNVEIGRVAPHLEENTEYHSVKLDDPPSRRRSTPTSSRARPITPRLVTLTDRSATVRPRGRRALPSDYVERGDPETAENLHSDDTTPHNPRSA